VVYFPTVKLGQLIKAKRIALGISRWRLSQYADIHPNQVKGLEEGSMSCKIGTAYKILNELGIDTIKIELLQEES